MTYVIAINPPNPIHLAAVKALMVEMGAPTIRVVRDDCAGVLVAIEGSHRLAACAELGIDPILDEMSGDVELICEEIGLDDCGHFGGEAVPVAQIAEWLAGPQGNYHGMPQYKF